MTLRRRTFIRSASALVAAQLGAPLFAQTFPDRTVTLVVPAPAGGTADITARMLAEPLGKALGQTVIVDTKGGGSGAVGAQAVINARPDGHSYLVAFSGFHTMSPHLVKLPYDPMKDLAPVANVLTAPQVLVVRSSLPFKTAGELISYAKAKPGQLNYGSAGNGSVQHIAAELLKQLTKTFMLHIPYRGTGPMLQDLLAGQIDLMLTTAPPLMGHIASGRIRALLVASDKRLESLPTVPTASEAGIQGLDVSSWFSLFTHANAPRAAIDRVSAEVKKIMATPEFQKKATEQGAQAIYLNPDEMGRLARADFEKWGKLIKATKITAD
jgi:tripartite-type tricarboxylate transporter receptor subunit TctC